MTGIDRPYTTLKETLQDLRIQVIDSLPYISDYVPKTIKTPSELFYFLKDKVKYKNDPKGVELLQTVQTLMKRGGKGDCDCFTILTLTACHYLGFEPQKIRLVGKTKLAPSHIYSMVWDEDKNKFCAMDLTNPYYCMERYYPFQQTLDFNMRVQLQDNFPLLAKSAKKKARQAARAERKATKRAAKTAKKAAKQQRKVVRQQQKTARKVMRQERRSDRVQQKGERKSAKRAVKTARKEKNLIRVQGKQEIIRQRQQNKLDRMNAQQEEALNNIQGGSFSPDFDGSQSDVIPQGYYDVPGGDYTGMSPDTYNSYPDVIDTDYEEVDSDIPQDEYEEDYNEPDDSEYYQQDYMPDDGGYDNTGIYPQMYDNGLSMPFLIPAVTGFVKKIGQKIKKAESGKVAQAVTKGTSKYNEIVNLQRENSSLKAQLEGEKKNKYIYGGAGTGIGLLTGFLLSKALK